MLRHENAVLRRQLTRPVRYDPVDRVWFAAFVRDWVGLRVARCWAAISSGASVGVSQPTAKPSIAQPIWSGFHRAMP